jgi:predicted CXXCH cytochrome family protein
MMPVPGSLRALVAILIIGGGTTAFAGQWHFDGHIVCSDCHTQHNSSSGEPMRTDNNPVPAARLLRRETSTELCLSCHDGSNPNAPDVIEPVSYVAESAAGAFPAVIDSPSTAHHLNSPTPEVPSGGTVVMVLLCTTCHDPHGNANYRNLRPDPLQPEATAGSITAVQTVTANGTNPAQVYVPSNIIYKSGISAWCAKCHGTPAAGAHPIDRPIFGATHANYAAWTSVSLARVPVDNPADNTVPSNDDRVNCLSCHKAHGSGKPRSVIHADASTLDSTCQECHNQ